jgi:hypothetical protein
MSSSGRDVMISRSDGSSDQLVKVQPASSSPAREWLGRKRRAAHAARALHPDDALPGRRDQGLDIEDPFARADDNGILVLGKVQWVGAETPGRTRKTTAVVVNLEWSDVIDRGRGGLPHRRPRKRKLIPTRSVSQP